MMAGVDSFLSPHFTLEEAIHSQIAARQGINNDAPIDIVTNLKRAAAGMELVRMELNSNAIIISSWYRCPELNKAVGSKPTSDHLTGLAIDFVCPTYGGIDTIVRKLISSGLKYRQIIKEYDSWVHISFNGDDRQALIIDKFGTRQFA